MISLAPASQKQAWKFKCALCDLCAPGAALGAVVGIDIWEDDGEGCEGRQLRDAHEGIMHECWCVTHALLEVESQLRKPGERVQAPLQEPGRHDLELAELEVGCLQGGLLQQAPDEPLVGAGG